MILKYNIGGLTAMLAGASLGVIVAQNEPMKVATGHRDLLLQTTQS